MRLLPFDYAARNAGRKPLRTILTVLGAGGVVFLVMLMGSFVETLASTLKSTGDPRNVIVLGSGSEDYMEQSAVHSNVPTILAASLPEIRKHHGTPIISAEIHHATTVRESKAGNDAAGTLRTGIIRGITPQAFLVHRQVFLTSGELPRTGEILVGRLAAAKLDLNEDAVAVGKKLFFEGRDWRISGRIDAPGTVFEAEIWAPLEDLRIQTKRDTITCAVVQVNSPAEAVDVDVFCKSRLDLELAALPETKYYGTLARFFRPIQILGWVMAGLVVLSGLFGGLNTVMAAINSRAKEIGCLQTIGFSRSAVIVSLMQETFVQVGAGALLAAGAAFLVFSGITMRFTMGALALRVDAPVLFAGFAAAAALAFLGTLLPSIRLMRTPLVDLLKS